MGALARLLVLLLLSVLGLVVALVAAGAGVLLSLSQVLAIAVQSIRFNDRVLPAALDLGPDREPATDGARVPAVPDPAYRQYVLGPALVDLWLLARDIVVMGAGWLSGHGHVPDRYRLADRYLGRVPASFVAADAHCLARFAVLLGPEELGVPGGPFLAVAMAAGALAGAVAALALIVTAAVMTGAVLAGACLAGWGLAYLLRAIESGSLWVRGITVECLDCQDRVKRPIYECSDPTCAVLHRRLLPGALGILRRYCRCGTHLPTLLAGGKFRLRARCQFCEAPLPQESLVSPTAHLLLAAGPSAGKTALFVRAMGQLQEHGAAWFATDLDTHPDDLRLALSLPDLSLLPPTRPQPDAMVRAAAIHVKANGSSRLVFVYDPAGEHLWRSQDLAGWPFLSHVTGLALVVDPFSLPVLGALLDDAARQRVRPCRVPPDDVRAEVVEAMHERLGLTRSWSRRLGVAVVVTKGDVLAELGEPGHPYEGLARHYGAPDGHGRNGFRVSGRVRDSPVGTVRSAGPDGPATGPFPRSPFPRQLCNQAIRAWLVQVGGQHHLVTSLESTFPRIGYFVTSAQPPQPAAAPRPAARTGRAVVNDHPAEVLRWLTGMSA